MQASSAFPLAFGPVSVKNCAVADETELYENGQCSKEWRVVKRKQFVDGGAFNNIPLGLAEMQLDVKNNIQVTDHSETDGVNCIFLDPLNRRGHNGIQNGGGGRAGEDKNLADFWLPFIDKFADTAMNQELFSVASTYHWVDWQKQLSGEPPPGEKTLISSDRKFPITGETANHFGAFFDRTFREYDFYVGIYDALFDISLYVCSEKDSSGNPPSPKERWECIGKKMGEYIDYPGLTAPYSAYVTSSIAEKDAMAQKEQKRQDAYYVITRLARQELKEHPGISWKFLEQYEKNLTEESKHDHDIAILADAVMENDSGDFKQLVLKLKKNNYKSPPEKKPAACELTQDAEAPKETSSYLPDDLDFAMQNLDAWKTTFGIKAVDRLLSIESASANKSDPFIKLLGGAEFTLRSSRDASAHREETDADFRKKFKQEWNYTDLDPSTVPDIPGTTFYHSLPYEVGINGSDGGLIFGYEPRYWGSHDWDLRVPVRVYEGANALNTSYMSAGILFSGSYIPWTSSLSIGPVVSWEMTGYGTDKWMGRDIHPGVQVKVGELADKVNFIVGKRDLLYKAGNWTDHWFFEFSINDFNGIFYWASKSL